MAIELKVFYSWQSDLPNNTNRGFIQKALEDAAKEISNDVTTDLEPVIDRDTAGVAGSPDIRQTILAKIESCDVFVADISVVGVTSNRPMCNPNVLIEVGYALKCLGDDRVLLVQNTLNGQIEDLPFDLRGRRIIAYKASPAEIDKGVTRKELARVLSAALRKIGGDLKEADKKSRQAENQRLFGLAMNFRSDRLSEIEVRHLPVPLINKPLVALHIIPLESFREEREFDLKTLISRTYSKIRPMGLSLRSYSQCSPNEHGVITVGTGDSDKAPFENSYTVLYRNGVIEAVRAGLIVRNEQNNLVTFLRYEESLLQYVRDCFQVISALGCSPPILVGIALFGIGGAQLVHPGDQYGMPSSRPFQNDTVLLPPIVFDDFSRDVGKVLKPALDRAWEQVGHMSSPYLNESGMWVGTGPWR